MKTNKVNYNGKEFEVTNTGIVYYNGEETKQFLNKKVGYMYCQYFDEDYGMYRTILVHRLVCAAFNPVEGWQNMQVDHKDNNKTNNVASNLRFVTRQFNNSRRHAKMMREKNRKLTIHDGEYVKAVNRETGEVRYFKNGKQTSVALGCSSPFVYMTLNGQTPSCYGWTLTYIPTDSEEVREFKKELMEKKAEKELEKYMALMYRRAVEREQKKKIRKLVKECAEFGVFLAKDFHVIQQLTLDGQLVKEWSSVHVATKATGLNGIRSAVKCGNRGDVCGGYIWRYKLERYSELVNSVEL